MTYKICFWDGATESQQERDATPDEAAEIDSRKLTALHPTQQEYTNALEAMYDSKAQERNYDNRMTCALRAGYAGPFQPEGLAFAIWMDTCNATAYQTMDKVVRNELAQPTIAELLATMPDLLWPV